MSSSSAPSATSVPASATQRSALASFAAWLRGGRQQVSRGGVWLLLALLTSLLAWWGMAGGWPTRDQAPTRPSNTVGSVTPEPTSSAVAAPAAGQGLVNVGSPMLMRTAELLGPRLSALDPIERAVALREWEAALSTPVRWGTGADWSAVPETQRARLLAGQPVELEEPVRVLVVVPREGRVPADGDLLVVGPLMKPIRSTPPTASDGLSTVASAVEVSTRPAWASGQSLGWLAWVAAAVAAATAMGWMLRRKPLTSAPQRALPSLPSPSRDRPAALLPAPLAPTTLAPTTLAPTTPAPAAEVSVPGVADHVGVSLGAPVSLGLPSDLSPSAIDSSVAVSRAHLIVNPAPRDIPTRSGLERPAERLAMPYLDGPVSLGPAVTVPAAPHRLGTLLREPPADAAVSEGRADLGDLAALLRSEVDRVRRQFGEGVQASADGSTTGLIIDFDPWLEGPVSHQPALMRRAVRSLLRVAAERASRHVVLSARIEGDCEVIIEVDDDGPIVAPGDADSGISASRRSAGYRTDGAEDDGGLAFVSSVAQWHGGRAGLERSPLGGVKCVLRWPSQVDPVMPASAATVQRSSHERSQERAEERAEERSQERAEERTPAQHTPERRDRPMSS